MKVTAAAMIAAAVRKTVYVIYSRKERQNL